MRHDFRPIESPGAWELVNRPSSSLVLQRQFPSTQSHGITSLAPNYDKSAISLQRQAESVRKQWPDLSIRIRKSTLEIEGKIQPTPLTLSYRFRLKYSVGSAPKIWILEPKLLTEKNGQKLEHVYRPDERPCVFHPAIDWTSRTYLGTTVIPWLSEWLFFYEIWLATDEWLGGGVHPGHQTEENFQDERSVGRKGYERPR